jgi:hypothetical protein
MAALKTPCRLPSADTGQNLTKRQHSEFKAERNDYRTDLLNTLLAERFRLIRPIALGLLLQWEKLFLDETDYSRTTDR